MYIFNLYLKNNILYNGSIQNFVDSRQSVFQNEHFFFTNCSGNKFNNLQEQWLFNE